MRWPWRSHDAEPESSPGADAGPRAHTPAPHDTWRSLAPVQRTTHEHTSACHLDTFPSTLSTRQDPGSWSRSATTSTRRSRRVRWPTLPARSMRPSLRTPRWDRPVRAPVQRAVQRARGTAPPLRRLQPLKRSVSPSGPGAHPRGSPSRPPCHSAPSRPPTARRPMPHPPAPPPLQRRPDSRPRRLPARSRRPSPPRNRRSPSNRRESPVVSRTMAAPCDLGPFPRHASGPPFPVRCPRSPCR